MLTTSLAMALIGFQSPTLTHVTDQPTAGPQGKRAEGVPPFWVRPGYKVSIAAEKLPQTRFMAFDDKGNLYVSSPDLGKITVLARKGDRYEVKSTYAEGYPKVQAMQFVDGSLWFATSGAIYKSKDSNGDGKMDDVSTVIGEGTVPNGSGHWWRSLLVTEDSIYTSVGDTGNANDLTDTERQKIWRFDRDGGNKRMFISGIRNTEKLLVRPGTKDIYGIDHGSDWFGGPLGDREGRQPITDFNPPDELNLYQEGHFYGHPFLTGFRVPRVEYQTRKDLIDLAEKTTVPVWAFGAHWAANSFCFISQRGPFPADHVGDIFAACHGSWNSKSKVGYRVERICFDPSTGLPYGSLVIVGCLDKDGNVLARPVDCVQAPDGSVLFSSDSDGRIYRIASDK